MIINYEGESYTFDMDDVTLKQAMAIEKHTGQPFGEWGKTVAAGSDLKALQAVGWLLLAGGDLGKPIADVDFKLTRLAAAFAQAGAGDEPPPVAPEPAERPTVAASSALPSNGTPVLSPLSSAAGS